MLQIFQLPFDGDTSGGDEIAIVSDGVTMFVICTWGFDYGSGMTIYSATPSQATEILNMPKVIKENGYPMGDYDIRTWCEANLTRCTRTP